MGSAIRWIGCFESGYGQTAGFGTPHGELRQRHQKPFSNLFIIFYFLLKNGSHRFRHDPHLIYIFSVSKNQHGNKRGPLQPALPTPGKSDVSDAIHKSSETLSFFILVFNLSAKKQKSSPFFKKNENFFKKDICEIAVRP